MASTTVPTPEKLADEWSELMGMPKPSTLREIEECEQKEKKEKEINAANKRKREESERKILYWKERELRKLQKIEKRDGIEKRKAARIQAM